MKMWITAAELAVILCIFIGNICLQMTWEPGKRVVTAYDNVCMFLKAKEGSLWSYERWDGFLKANGAFYHFGGWINPFTFILLSGGMGLLGLLLGTYFGSFWATFGTLGLFLPGLYLEYANRRDNRKMTADLDLIYCALGIQIRAGVYVTDALAECCGRVSHRRLRDSLQMLSGDIVMKADLDDALENFQKSFNNSYIDTLCITILQAMESGQAVELLADISEQIKEMQLLLQSRKKEQLDRSVTFYQLGIFAFVLVLTLYACLTQLLADTTFFY